MVGDALPRRASTGTLAGSFTNFGLRDAGLFGSREHSMGLRPSIPRPRASAGVWAPHDLWVREESRIHPTVPLRADSDPLPAKSRGSGAG